MAKKNKKNKKSKVDHQSKQKVIKTDKGVDQQIHTKKKRVIPDLGETLRKEELIRYQKFIHNLVAGVLIFASLGIISWLGWQIIWKALTPDTLMRFLPEQTALAIEQYGYSNLPLVKQSQELLAVGPTNTWQGQRYPVAVNEILLQSKPQRVLQSWHLQSDNLYHPLLIVEPSLVEYRTNDNELKILETEYGTWFIQQFRPGYYAISTQKHLLDQNSSRLTSRSKVLEAQHNLPDQYYISGYIDPVQLVTTIRQTNDWLVKFTTGIGPTLFTLTPNSDGFNLLSYSTPNGSNQTFVSNVNKYDLSLAGVLPPDPLLFMGGIEVSSRLASLASYSDQTKSLQKRFQEQFAGLKLETGFFPTVLDLLNQEVAYAEYENGKVLLIRSSDTNHFQQLVNLGIGIYNYLNPVKEAYTLRDGTTGFKLVPAQNTALPDGLNYITINSENWSIKHFAEGIIAISNNESVLDQVENNLASPTTSNSIIGTDQYKDDWLSVSISADDLTYLSNQKLGSYRSYLPEPIQDAFSNIDSIIFTHNFFTDGIQTYNLIKLKNEQKKD